MNYPITRASLNLTRNCNLACSYCFTYGCRVGRMSEEIAYKAVDFLFKNADKVNPVEISFWGGEPLLEWSLLQKIVLYAKEKSVQVVVPVTFGGTTNGTLLTEEKFDFLDEHKIFFLVSLDGTQETHDFYRRFKDGQGSHATIMKNMEKVLERWPFYRPRLGLTADSIHNLYNDVKYLIDFGFNSIIFSPVYETKWTDEKWKIFEEQGYKIVDLLKTYRDNGHIIEIEHFKSYQAADNSKYPCGGGRNYVGIDIDGAIAPCHRFFKFDDKRAWQDKEICIGHIDHGITRSEFRQSFIDFSHNQCNGCARLKDTPCNSGCYAVNFDFTGDIKIPHIGLCKYVEVQKKISMYYKEKIGDKAISQDKNCICNFEHYTGPVIDNPPTISLETIALLISDLNNRVSALERRG